MTRIYTEDESSLSRRRFPIYLVDALDGITPETGEAGGQPQISIHQGVFSNTSGTLISVGNGNYYITLAAVEVTTPRIFSIRYKSVNTAEFSLEGKVVPFDVYTRFPPALVRMFESTLQTTVDNATFTPTTTEFETDQTDNDPEEWTGAGLFWSSGPNIGTTVFVTAYAFTNSKVKLTVSTMETAPTNGDSFIRMGRKF